MKGICPLCGEPNKCAFSLGKDPSTCWCMNIKVPNELLEQVPQEERGKNCVCEVCVKNIMKSKKSK